MAGLSRRWKTGLLAAGALLIAVGGGLFWYRRPQAVRTGDMDFHFMSGVSNAGVIDRPADVDARFADELVLPVTLLKRNRLFSAPEFSVVTEVDGVRRQSGYFGGCRSYYGQLYVQAHIPPEQSGDAYRYTFTFYESDGWPGAFLYVSRRGDTLEYTSDPPPELFLPDGGQAAEENPEGPNGTEGG